MHRQLDLRGGRCLHSDTGPRTSATITARQRGAALVVRVAGTLDHWLLDAIGDSLEVLAQGGRLVVLDLTVGHILEPDAVDDLVERMAASPGSLVVLAPRPALPEAPQ
jgi:hypothetical protein